MQGFRLHGRTSGESSSHVLADRDRHIGQERYLDNLLGFTRSHTTLSQSLFPKSDPVKSGEIKLQLTTAVPYFGAGLSEHLTGGSRYDFHDGND
jgi:hypothetical protein